MLTARIFFPYGGFSEATLDEALASMSTQTVWIDVVGRHPQDLALLQQCLGLHALAVDDALSAHQRPKLEDYGNHLFVVFYGLGSSPEEADDEEWDVFITPNVVVTVREGRTTDLAPVLRRLDRDWPEGAKAGFVGWAIMDEVVDNYFTIVDQIDDAVDELEDAVFATPRPPNLQERIFEARKLLIRLRRRVTPMRDILNTLIAHADISRAVVPYLQDVYDHTLRITDTLDTFRDLIASAHESYLTEVSNDMNRVMKRFTSIGAILVSGAIVTGIYGMNFEHMPELDWVVGYPLALATMVALMGALYWFFKHRDWI